MPMKVYRCVHCNTRFTVLATETNSLLPVEVNGSSVIVPGEKFNSKKHVSHLLNCKERRDDWKKVKEYFIPRDLKNLTLKELAR